mmetsp:Transcript_29148/g.44780  ORF Transcript_29148/g.44780 Transcript_29148/m.44780 type:complete len:82 (+) Transcript_29148:92-337(+)
MKCIIVLVGIFVGNTKEATNGELIGLCTLLIQALELLLVWLICCVGLTSVGFPADTCQSNGIPWALDTCLMTCLSWLLDTF